MDRKIPCSLLIPGIHHHNKSYLEQHRVDVWDAWWWFVCDECGQLHNRLDGARIENHNRSIWREYHDRTG